MCSGMTSSSPTPPSPLPQALLSAVQEWLEQDPDAETREELSTLLDTAMRGDEGAVVELQDRFAGRLAFGTAGLRGVLGAGPNRMNQVVVAQTAAGLAAFLHGRVVDRAPRVAIGFDGRKNSRVFAELSAEILAGAGVDVAVMAEVCPTPVLAFTVRHVGADCGVMVTASHNPARDNGYKVYLGGADGGSQIVPPADAEIATCIDAVAAAGPIGLLPRGEYARIPNEVVTAYVSATAQLGGPSKQPVRVAYTALHGVGAAVFARVLAEAGFPPVTVVTEQNEPDAAFPTVAYPNPEEVGALDLAFDLAGRVGADVVVANDPDADRLAVAIPDADAAGEWRRLTGNEVGLLLGWWIARAVRGVEGVPLLPRTGRTLSCSIVSSPALEEVAAAYGLAFAPTLTGFKWISRSAELLFGFEEALGYLVDPDRVRDKDGISAAAMFLGMVGWFAERGLTVEDALNEFALRFGCHLSEQLSVRVTDLSRLSVVMAGLRAMPPTAFAGVPVTGMDDFGAGLGGLPASDVLRFWLADGTRVMVRPSGTEPKLKVYVDVVSRVGSVTERKQDAQERMRMLMGELADRFQ